MRGFFRRYAPRGSEGGECRMRNSAAAFFVGILIALIPIGAAGQDVEVSKVSFDGNWLFPEKKLIL